MRKVGTITFAAASIAVLMTAGGCRSFRPGVNLPELDAGKPFTKWDGVVLTLKRDGPLSLNGQATDRDKIREQFEAMLKKGEAEFNKRRTTLPVEWARKRACMTPVFLCIDKDTPLQECLPLLFFTCQMLCHDVCFAVRKGPGLRAVSFCSYFYSGGDFYGYWKDEPIWLTGAVRQLKVRARKEGRYRFTSLSGRWADKMTWVIPLIEGEEPETYQSIEPLFELIAQHKDEDIVVVMDFLNNAKNLKWQWLAQLLLRLEKTPIRGYLFVVPDVSY